MYVVVDFGGTKPSPPTILSHPFSLLTSSLGNRLGIAMMMIPPLIPRFLTMIILPKTTTLLASGPTICNRIAMTTIPLNPTKHTINDFGKNTTSNRY